jgi:hypothetical protein
MYKENFHVTYTEKLKTERSLIYESATLLERIRGKVAGSINDDVA